AYEERVAKLLASGIGLWEVLESCHRPSSLDSAINLLTMQPNDFNAFFAAHPNVKHVFFNGGLAADAFRRRVKPTLLPDYGYIQYERLPSTSRSEEHTSELQSRENLVCRLLLEKKKR